MELTMLQGLVLTTAIVLGGFGLLWVASLFVRDED